MAIESTEELLTVNEVAERLKVHPITVRRHIKAGRLRALRAGRSIRVRASDLEEYLSGEDEEYTKPSAKTSAELIKETRRILRSIPNVKRPHRWPPTQEEMERRKRLAEQGFRRRDERGHIGMDTTDLVRQARGELEEKYDRTSRASGRRLRRRKMASDRREPYQRS